MKKYFHNMAMIMNFSYPDSICNCCYENEFNEDSLCDLCKCRVINQREKMIRHNRIQEKLKFKPVG